MAPLCSAEREHTRAAEAGAGRAGYLFDFDGHVVQPAALRGSKRSI